MARNRNLMDPGDIAPRFGKKKAARAVLNEDRKPVLSSAKGDNARVGVPTRQLTAGLDTSSSSGKPLENRVGIPTRQLTSNLSKVKKPSGIQRAISMIASRKTPRTKR